MRGTQFVASTLTASPIVLEPCCSLKAPRNVPGGFGDKVALSRDGSTMAVEAEWEQPNGSSCSAVFVAERIPHQGRLHYTSWVTVPVPAELSYYSRRPEFGTSIKLTADGRQLLASIEDLTLPLRASSIVPLGYVYRKVAPGPRFEQHGEALYVDITVSHSDAVKRSNPNATLSIDTSRALMSDDGATVAFTTELSLEVPEQDRSGSPPSLPGMLYIFQYRAGTYHLFQEISTPLGQKRDANFGKNSTMSADGKWIAVTEDTNASVYVYGRSRISEPFQLHATVSNLFDTTDGNAEVEEVALSPDGSYMVVGWKLPENVGATRSETGAFAVYVRTCVGHWRVANYKYVQVCGSETGIKSLDGVRMATAGHWIRVVLGFAGEEARIYDLDIKARTSRLIRTPVHPTFVIPAAFRGRSLNDYGDPENVDTVFEGVEVSGDGCTVALGAEAQNAVYLLDLPPPGATLRG